MLNELQTQEKYEEDLLPFDLSLHLYQVMMEHLNWIPDETFHFQLEYEPSEDKRLSFDEVDYEYLTSMDVYFKNIMISENEDVTEENYHTELFAEEFIQHHHLIEYEFQNELLKSWKKNNFMHSIGGIIINQPFENVW